MKNIRIFILLALIFFVTGCAHNTKPEIVDLTDLVTDNGTSSMEIETNTEPVNPDALYYLEGAPGETYWPDTFPEQTSFIVGNGDTIYVGLHWFNLNYVYMNGPNFEPTWGGVLVSYDHGDSYEPLYYSEPVKDPAGQRKAIYYNPVGIFRSGDKITLDIVDDRGAGSGEGYLARMVAEDDASEWKIEKCFFYSVETYMPMASLGGEMKIEDTKNLQPAKLSDCLIE